MSLRVAQVTAELSGLAQTGGLADAVAALSKGLGVAGHEVRVFLPLYGSLDGRLLDLVPEPRVEEVVIPFAERELTFSVVTSAWSGGSVTLHLIDCPEAFGRQLIYDSAGDEHFRFALLARAALECCQRLEWRPEVFHCHDWHAALLPLYLRGSYAWDELFSASRAVLTIHNLAYQGAFPHPAAADLGFESRESDGVASFEAGGVNFLATGIRHSDWLTTVSPSYAREIRTPAFGAGLDSLLDQRADRLEGILNGVDDDIWDPTRDPAIPSTYSRSDLDGKVACRRELLAELDLRPDPEGPVFGIVSRLAEQKGLGLVLDVVPGIIEREDARLVVLGSGEPRLEKAFRALAERFPGQVAFVDRFDTALSHRIEAGSDAFLMPSRFEPCGLNQMYSQRYGTPPIVHRVGGLADTVEAFDSDDGTGTGFVFEGFTAEEFRQALEQAVWTFRRTDRWRLLMRNGMARDFSWARQVEAYVDMYRRVLALPPSADRMAPESPE
jgi:starch synthase